MENVPPLSGSGSSSSDSSPKTPISVSQSVLQSLPLKRPDDDSGVKPAFIPLHPSSRLQSPLTRGGSTMNCIGKRTAEANFRMQRSFGPYKYHASTWSPELRFASRAVGKTSRPYLTVEELIKGDEIFKSGLSQLPSELLKKVYIAKCASRDSILARLSTSLRELDALEKMKDVFLEMHKYDEKELTMVSEDLALYKAEVENRGTFMEDDVAYRHAVYADEFTALASTNTQLNLMLGLLDSRLSSSGDSDLDASDDADSSPTLG